MDRQFKILESNIKVDLIPYCKEYIRSREGIQILVGCDSQNRKRNTLYAVVIALYTPGKGGHVLYTKFSSPREKNDGVRLINEAWYSTETAEFMKSNGLPMATFIDIDLNPDKKFRSNQQLATAIGIPAGLGYNVRHKGQSPVMTYAADRLVKN